MHAALQDVPGRALQQGNLDYCMHWWMQQSSDVAPGCYTAWKRTWYEKRVKLCRHKNWAPTRPTMPSGFVSPLQRSLSLYSAYWPVPDSATTFYCDSRDTNARTVECVSTEAGQQKAERTNTDSSEEWQFLLQPLKVDLIQQTRPLVVSVNNLVLGLESGLVSMRCQQLCERWDLPSCGCGTDAFKTRVAASGASVFAYPR